MAVTVSALVVLVCFIISAMASATGEIQHEEVRPRELDFTDASQYIARTGHSSMLFYALLTTESFPTDVQL